MKRTDLWTPEEEAYLRLRYPLDAVCDIAEALGRSNDAVRTRATLLKLMKAHQKKRWTADDDEKIRQEYPLGDVKAMAKAFGCTMLSLYQHAKIIGVKRDKAMVLAANRALGKKLANAGAGSRFTKGHISHNRGKKQTDYMSASAIAKTQATRFKKGIVPHNYKPVGHERTTTDGYIEIKVRDGDDSRHNFMLKQRLVYEKHHGCVPDGCIVEFIDGCRDNCDIANLRAVTRRENAIRNGQSDKAILKRFLKIKDEAEIAEYIEKYPHVIEMKRAQIKVNGKLRQLKKNAGKPQGPTV